MPVQPTYFYKKSLQFPLLELLSLLLDLYYISITVACIVLHRTDDKLKREVLKKVTKVHLGLYLNFS